jgi:long-chain acyl-CoA synthetase
MNFTTEDVALSYLPYAHLFEQAFFIYTCFIGMKNGYYQGSPLLLFDDIETLKPTMLLSVPRILNRIYNKIFEDVSRKNGFVQWLFNRGVSSKQSYLESEGAFGHKFYDNLVFKAVRAKFGGNLRILVTGSAPISPEII